MPISVTVRTAEHKPFDDISVFNILRFERGHVSKSKAATDTYEMFKHLMEGL